jgi:NAD(P)-dependent dehydrogenase (short-subunit alcohol dehydrogenase family)
MTEARTAFGRIDVLVDNVGGTIWIKPFHLYTAEEVELGLERSLFAEEAERYRREMAEDIRNQEALRRHGLPEEQAAAIAFLASDDASFITGQVINCSGGQS